MRRALLRCALALASLPAARSEGGGVDGLISNVIDTATPGLQKAVDLAPGEMCLYESAKMYHARMAPMRGRHYGSVFVHFYPDSERLQDDES